MSIAALAFYLFAICVLTGGLFTVISRLPFRWVVWLFLSFV